MKRKLFPLGATLLLLLVLIVLAIISCSQSREWSAEQRSDFREALGDYRQMVYLSSLTEPEFVLFTDDVATEIEVAYPVYVEFIKMPAVSDTVDMWVVRTIAEQIETDASSMRHLYPYHILVAQGILPAELNEATQKEFYTCFSGKVNHHFESLSTFFYAVVTNSVDHNEIHRMQRECAAGLFFDPEVPQGS